MKLPIYIGGFYSLAFAIFHMAFWRLFDWKSELAKLRPVNRGVMQVLNLRLIYVFLAVAVVSLLFADELLGTTFGNFILAVIAFFWFTRAIEQPIFWGLRSAVSIAFFFIFLLGTALFSLPLILQWTTP